MVYDAQIHANRIERMLREYKSTSRIHFLEKISSAAEREFRSSKFIVPVGEENRRRFLRAVLMREH